MAKDKRIDKDTRRLMESISDLVKRKGDGYKFKAKSKKTVKKVKKTCVHWIYRKGRPVPTVIQDPEKAGYWKCKICGASFPIRPLDDVDGLNSYEAEVEHMIELVNQIQFWGVKMGGNSDDLKMFLRLRDELPRFEKVAKQIVKRINKRESMANQSNRDAMSQFNSYSSFNYR